MRILKDPEVRRTEIMDAAWSLFSTKGYQATTIIDILQDTEIAKGTFYYYFKSKEEILDAIIARIVQEDVAQAEKIVEDAAIPVFDKLFQVLLGQRPEVENGKAQMLDQIHQPSNAEMHQKSLVESVKHMAPVLAKIVEQGIEEGVMHTAYPKETIELLIVAGQTIFDKSLFQWSPEEVESRVRAFICLMESSLGAKKGSFNYMTEIL